MSETDYLATVAAAAVKYPVLRVTRFDAAIDGDAATVNYETSSPEISKRDQRWVFERGHWRFDGC